MKQVKFNLYVDQQKIRTIEELVEHFNIDDLLEWYELGVLQKWLSVRNYEKEMLDIDAIEINDKYEIAKSIITTFKFSEDQAKHALDSVNYRLNYAQEQSEINSNDNTLHIEEYHARYDEIKNILLKRVM